MNADIEQPVPCQLLVDRDETITMGATLGYRLDDPYAVTLTLTTGDVSTSWSMARDLLGVGLYEEVGDGDVVVFPGWAAGRPLAMVLLAGPKAEVLLQMDAGVVQNFLRRTLNVVGFGLESPFLNVGQCVWQILAAAG